MNPTASCPYPRASARPAANDPARDPVATDGDGVASAAAVADAAARFADYVMDAGFPCVGARSALNRGRYRFGLFGALGDAATAEPLCKAIYAFQQAFETPGTDPVSFVATFDGAPPESEEAFEALLWRQLDALHDVDRQRHRWDASVSADPSSAAFSFSVGGRAMFVVGLHPKASRLARRAPKPTLVFNFHAQFEAMRENGKYQGMQKVVRQRDLALQGSINPVLARFGEASEALQYAGRAVGADWQCPFSARVAA